MNNLKSGELTAWIFSATNGQGVIMGVLSERHLEQNGFKVRLDCRFPETGDPPTFWSQTFLYPIEDAVSLVVVVGVPLPEHEPEAVERALKRIKELTGRSIRVTLIDHHRLATTPYGRAVEAGASVLIAPSAATCHYGFPAGPSAVAWARIAALSDRDSSILPVTPEEERLAEGLDATVRLNLGAVVEAVRKDDFGVFGGEVPPPPGKVQVRNRVARLEEMTPGWSYKQLSRAAVDAAVPYAVGLEATNGRWSVIAVNNWQVDELPVALKLGLTRFIGHSTAIKVPLESHSEAKQRLEDYLDRLAEVKGVPTSSEPVDPGSLFSFVAWLMGQIDIPYFLTQHGWPHVLRVVSHARTLGSLFSLCAEDQRVLDYAALFHDVGHGWPDVSEDEARQQHHVFSQRMVLQWASSGLLASVLSDSQVHLVGELCLRHRKQMELPESGRPRLLTSLLRVADAMDIDARRATQNDGGILYEDLELTDEQRQHWDGHRAIEAIRLAAHGEELEFQLLISDETAADFQIAQLQQELKSMKEFKEIRVITIAVDGRKPKGADLPRVKNTAVKKTVAFTQPNARGVLSLAQSLANQPELVPFLRFSKDEFATMPHHFWRHFNVIREGFSGQGELATLLRDADEVVHLVLPLDSENYDACVKQLVELLSENTGMKLKVLSDRVEEMGFYAPLDSFGNRFELVIVDSGGICLGQAKDATRAWLRQAGDRQAGPMVSALKTAVQGKGPEILLVFARSLALVLQDPATSVPPGGLPEDLSKVLAMAIQELTTSDPLPVPPLEQLPEAFLKGNTTFVFERNPQVSAANYFSARNLGHVGIWLSPLERTCQLYNLTVDLTDCRPQEVLDLIQYLSGGQAGWHIARRQKVATLNGPIKDLVGPLGGLLRRRLGWAQPLSSIAAPEEIAKEARALTTEWGTGLYVTTSSDGEITAEFLGGEAGQLCPITGHSVAVAAVLAATGVLDVAQMFPLLKDLVQLRRSCTALHVLHEDGASCHDAFNRERLSTDAFDQRVAEIDAAVFSVTAGIWAREEKMGVVAPTFKAELNTLQGTDELGKRVKAFKTFSQRARFRLRDELNEILTGLSQGDQLCLSSNPSSNPVHWGINGDQDCDGTILSLGWLRVLVEELIRNACNHAWVASPSFPLIWFRLDQGENWTLLQMADNGRGLPSEEANSLWDSKFSWFTRAHKARMKIFRGSQTLLDNGHHWGHLPNEWNHLPPVTLPIVGGDPSANVQLSALQPHRDDQASGRVLSLSNPEIPLFGDRSRMTRRGGAGNSPSEIGNPFRDWGDGTRLALLIHRLS